MKFEQLLQIYWTRGFLYGGNSEKYDCEFNEFFLEKQGLNLLAKKKFILRFELNFFAKKNKNFLHFPIEQKKIINMYLSQLTSINHSRSELIRYNYIRLYLIKSFRGRCHLLGKPLRGQRTWSNAWTALKMNAVLKQFIADVKKFNKITKKVETLNRKKLQKKIKKKPQKIKMIFTKKQKNFWF